MRMFLPRLHPQGRLCPCRSCNELFHPIRTPQPSARRGLFDQDQHIHPPLSASEELSTKFLSLTMGCRSQPFLPRQVQPNETQPSLAAGRGGEDRSAPPLIALGGQL